MIKLKMVYFRARQKLLGPSPSTSNISPDSATSVEGSDVTTIVPYNSIVGQIDLGVVVHAAQNSLDRLRHISEEMPDAQRMQYLSSPVVLNLGSIEPQGFGESVSGVRRFGSPHSYDS